MPLLFRALEYEILVRLLKYCVSSASNDDYRYFMDNIHVGGDLCSVVPCMQVYTLIQDHNTINIFSGERFQVVCDQGYSIIFGALMRPLSEQLELF
jgi:hypothetical protein